jgi:hypothetical protein
MIPNSSDRFQPDEGTAGTRRNAAGSGEFDPEAVKQWPRSARHIALVVWPSLMLGVLFASCEYLGPRYQASYERRMRKEALDGIHHPYWRVVRMHFEIGAGAGAFLGLMFVVRCVVKREEP